MSNVTLECPKFDWIPESELPYDWEGALNRGFSEIGEFYHDSVLANPASKKTQDTVNGQIGSSLSSRSIRDILDVGVGDGSRLVEISPQNARLYGIETSKIMADASRKKGITVAVHDFKTR